MGAKKRLRAEDQASDQEDPETQLSDAEGEEDPTAPETDTDRVPAEELTNEDLLRGMWRVLGFASQSPLSPRGWCGRRLGLGVVRRV